MEQNIKDLGLIAGANLKRLIKNSKYKTQEEFAFEFREMGEQRHSKPCHYTANSSVFRYRRSGVLL